MRGVRIEAAIAESLKCAARRVVRTYEASEPHMHEPHVTELLRIAELIRVFNKSQGRLRIASESTVLSEMLNEALSTRYDDAVALWESAVQIVPARAPRKSAYAVLLVRPGEDAPFGNQGWSVLWRERSSQYNEVKVTIHDAETTGTPSEVDSLFKRYFGPGFTAARSGWAWGEVFMAGFLGYDSDHVQFLRPDFFSGIDWSYEQWLGGG